MRHAWGLGAALAFMLSATSMAPAFATWGDLIEDEARLSDAFKANLELRRWKANPDPLVAYAHAPLCNVGSAYLAPGIDGECSPPNGTVTVPGCGDDSPVEPLWRRTRPSAAAEDWTRWEMLSGWVCPEDLLPPFPQEDFRRLKIDPLTAHRQPAGDEALVNKPLIVYLDPEHRTFRTSLFTYGIDVDVYPVEYSWDFGDGTTLTTVSPGSPYPSFDVTHTYTEPGNRSVLLTTTWKGKYRVDEDPDGEWRDITGTATTTTPLDPFDVIELRSRLVG